MSQDDQIERATYSIDEAAARLGIGRQLAYRLAREGDLPSLHLGNRIVVPKEPLERLLAAAAGHREAAP